MQLQKSGDFGWSSYARPFTYAREYITENQRVVIYGVFKGKKRTDDI